MPAPSIAPDAAITVTTTIAGYTTTIAMLPATLLPQL